MGSDALNILWAQAVNMLMEPSNQQIS